MNQTSKTSFRGNDTYARTLERNFASGSVQYADDVLYMLQVNMTNSAPYSEAEIFAWSEWRLLNTRRPMPIPVNRPSVDQFGIIRETSGQLLHPGSYRYVAEQYFFTLDGLVKLSKALPAINEKDHLAKAAAAEWLRLLEPLPAIDHKNPIDCRILDLVRDVANNESIPLRHMHGIANDALARWGEEPGQGMKLPEVQVSLKAIEPRLN